MTLETAVVGGGVRSERHLSGLQRCPDTTLTAICDPDETRARDRATEYDITAFADFEGLLARESPDWIHICTPPQTRLELVRMALEDGIDVHIPAPVTTSVSEAQEVERLAGDYEARVSLAHRQAFSPAMRQAGRLLGDGAIGDTQSVSLVYTADESEREDRQTHARAGRVDVAAHERLVDPILLLLELAGYPASPSSIRTAASVTSEEGRAAYDTVQFQYSTDDGATATATVLPADVPHRSTQIHGADGRLDVDLVTQSVTKLDHAERTTPTEQLRGDLEHVLGRTHAMAGRSVSAAKRAVRSDWETMCQLDGYCYQIDEEVQAIRNGGPVPVPVEAGTWALRIMDAIGAERWDPWPDEPVRISTDSA